MADLRSTIIDVPSRLLVEGMSLHAKTTIKGSDSIITQDEFLDVISRASNAHQAPSNAHQAPSSNAHQAPSEASDLFTFTRPTRKPNKTRSGLLMLNNSQHNVLYALSGCSDVTFIMSRVKKEVRKALHDIYNISPDQLTIWFKNRRAAPKKLVSNDSSQEMIKPNLKRRPAKGQSEKPYSTRYPNDFSKESDDYDDSNLEGSIHHIHRPKIQKTMSLPSQTLLESLLMPASIKKNHGLWALTSTGSHEVKHQRQEQRNPFESAFEDFSDLDLDFDFQEGDFQESPTPMSNFPEQDAASGNLQLSMAMGQDLQHQPIRHDQPNLENCHGQWIQHQGGHGLHYNQTQSAEHGPDADTLHQPLHSSTSLPMPSRFKLHPSRSTIDNMHHMERSEQLPGLSGLTTHVHATQMRRETSAVDNGGHAFRVAGHDMRIPFKSQETFMDSEHDSETEGVIIEGNVEGRRPLPKVPPTTWYTHLSGDLRSQHLIGDPRSQHCEESSQASRLPAYIQNYGLQTDESIRHLVARVANSAIEISRNEEYLSRNEDTINAHNYPKSMATSSALTTTHSLESLHPQGPPSLHQYNRHVTTQLLTSSSSCNWEQQKTKAIDAYRHPKALSATQKEIPITSAFAPRPRSTPIWHPNGPTSEAALKNTMENFPNLPENRLEAARMASAPASVELSYPDDYINHSKFRIITDNLQRPYASARGASVVDPMHVATSSPLDVAQIHAAKSPSRLKPNIELLKVGRMMPSITKHPLAEDQGVEHGVAPSVSAPESIMHGLDWQLLVTGYKSVSDHLNLEGTENHVTSVSDHLNLEGPENHVTSESDHLRLEGPENHVTSESDHLRLEGPENHVASESDHLRLEGPENHATFSHIPYHNDTHASCLPGPSDSTLGHGHGSASFTWNGNPYDASRLVINDGTLTLGERHNGLRMLSAEERFQAQVDDPRMQLQTLSTEYQGHAAQVFVDEHDHDINISNIDLEGDLLELSRLLED